MNLIYKLVILCFFTLFAQRLLAATTKPTIIFFGTPGSGKSSFAQILNKEFGYEYFSLGDVLRSHIKRDDEIGKRLRSLAQQAHKENLVPDSLLHLVRDFTRPLIETFIDTCQAQKKSFMLDNVVRSTQDLEDLVELVDKKHLTIVVLHFTAEESVIRERVQHRIICRSCHAVYNTALTPLNDASLCHICHQPITIREFDDVKSLEMRMKFYHEQVTPLLEKLRKTFTVITYDTTSLSPEEYHSLAHSLIHK